MSKKVKLLDCTLRDGGYYNSWNFDKHIVQSYLNDVNKAQIDFIEIGFRRLPSAFSSFVGPYAFTSEEFLNGIETPDSLNLGVMINADEYLNENLDELIDSNFTDSSNSKIKLVRIAINFDRFEESLPLISRFKDLGYLVGLNLMQSHGKDEKTLRHTSKTIEAWGKLDILYFADSLGSMEPKDIDTIVKIFKKEWNGDIGFHSHDNKGFGLLNSIQAIKSGVSWVDATISGMGRGAGNTSTESLLLEMNSQGFHNGNALELSASVENFDKLKEHFKWGKNIYYHFAALKGIHPTYVQNILSEDKYDSEQIFSALNALAKNQSSSFSLSNLEEAVYTKASDSKGSWDPKDWLKEKEVLLVGAGPSVDEFKDEISSFSKNKEVFTIFLNSNQHLPNNICDATVVSQVSRALIENIDYHALSTPIIMPLGRFKNLFKLPKGLQILDYGLEIDQNSFDFNNTNCSLPSPLVTAYALGIIHRANAKKIYLCLLASDIYLGDLFCSFISTISR